MSKCCPKRGNSPHKGVKRALSSGEAHTSTRTGARRSSGRLHDRVLRDDDVHSAKNIFARLAGSLTLPGNAVGAAERTAAVALLCGGELGVMLTRTALDVNGRGLINVVHLPLEQPEISSWERASKDHSSPRRCEDWPSLLATASHPARSHGL